MYLMLDLWVLEGATVDDGSEADLSAPRAMWMLPFLSLNFLLLPRLVVTVASLGFHNNATKGRGKGRAAPRPLLIGG